MLSCAASNTSCLGAKYAFRTPFLAQKREASRQMVRPQFIGLRGGQGFGSCRAIGVGWAPEIKPGLC